MWLAFAIDGVIFVIISISFRIDPVTGGRIRSVFEFVSYAIVALAAYLAARKSGKISRALAGGVLFWFVWKPLLFFMSGLGGLLWGETSMDHLTTSTIGAVVALVLFSPLALISSAVGGWLARMLLRGAAPQ